MKNSISISISKNTQLNINHIIIQKIYKIYKCNHKSPGNAVKKTPWGRYWSCSLLLLQFVAVIVGAGSTTAATGRRCCCSWPSVPDLVCATGSPTAVVALQLSSPFPCLVFSSRLEQLGGEGDIVRRIHSSTLTRHLKIVKFLARKYNYSELCGSNILTTNSFSELKLTLLEIALG